MRYCLIFGRKTPNTGIRTPTYYIIVNNFCQATGVNLHNFSVLHKNIFRDDIYLDKIPSQVPFFSGLRRDNVQKLTIFFVNLFKLIKLPLFHHRSRHLRQEQCRWDQARGHHVLPHRCYDSSPYPYLRGSAYR